MNNAEQKFDFRLTMTTARRSHGLKWLTLNPVCCPQAASDRGQRGTAVVALLPAFSGKRFISLHEYARLLAYLSAIVNHP